MKTLETSTESAPLVDFNTYSVQFEKEKIVATALVAAGFGWFTDNGLKFCTRDDDARAIYENALQVRDGNHVRRFVSRLDM